MESSQPASCCRNDLGAFLDFPIPAVEALDFDFSDVDSFEASNVNAELGGIGARISKGCHSAFGTKVVASEPGAPLIRQEVLPRSQHPELRRLDAPVQKARAAAE
jgi:hypothetical protein